MNLINGLFSNLDIKTIKGKKVCIVDSHNYVFPIWAQHYYLNCEKPCNLITFDFHSDTMKSFLRYIFKNNSKLDLNDYKKFEELNKERISNININDMHSLILAADELKNDEHIDAACKLDIINEFHTVINGPTYCKDYYHENGFSYNSKPCYSLCPRRIICNGDCTNPKKYYSMILSDITFKDIKFTIPKNPIILDFDLDYFPCRSSLTPANSSILNSLIKKADIITIAREKDCFNYSRKEDDFNNDEAESLLLKLIERALL